MNPARVHAGKRLVRSIATRLDSSVPAVLAAERYVTDRLESGDNVWDAANTAGTILVREFVNKERSAWTS